MTIRSILRAGTAALAFASLSPALRAQEIVPQPTPNADALAAQMRVLGADPRNVEALIAAGDLSTRLGDPAAALGFFGRAQSVSPTNPRIAAGKAGALILLERPGEALRLYAQAEAQGLSMTSYLAQRGLAYDLIGQPGYAQRDYRAALRFSADDETVRRLALSLGISGRREEAMALLDPLLRRSDRAAWRARACILAIGGDAGGARKIATNMMPGGGALGPFFDRLQALSPADRAFAVHFGEVKSSVARSNDARLAPALAALSAEPAPQPTRVASAVTASAPAKTPERGGRTKLPAGRQPIEVAAVAPTPTPTPAGQALAKREPIPIYTLPRQPAVSAYRTSAPAPAPNYRPTPAPTPAPTPVPSAPTATPLPARVTPAPTWAVTADTAAPRPAAIEVAAATPTRAPVTLAPSPPIVSSPAPPPPTPIERSGLESIIGSITVPQSELVAPPPVVRTIPTPRAVTAAAVRKPAAAVAEPKKPEPKKPELKRSDPAKADPARWWVQVAGGARVADLDKDWKRLTAKSAALKGRGAYTTPLRATNRLLTGPFKTEAEARGVVNTLAREGTSAFAFQSEAGQKIDKLGAK